MLPANRTDGSSASCSGWGRLNRAVRANKGHASVGPLAKGSLAVLALAGTALAAVLVYRAAWRPGVPAVPVDRAVGAPAPAVPAAPVPPSQDPPPAPNRPDAPLTVDILTPDKLFERASVAVGRIVVRDADSHQAASGSGFFVSADGCFITNYHVVQAGESASVQLPDERTLPVEGIAAVDAEADLVLLKVSGEGLPHLALDDGPPPRIGSRVYAIGHPQGLTNTFSEGIISGLRPINDHLTLLQTTAAISSGSSGGPLLDADGKVVGVIAARLIGVGSLNFAVPAAHACRLLRDRGPLRDLTGRDRVSIDVTAGLQEAWSAIAAEKWLKATRILLQLIRDHQDDPLVWFSLGYLEGELGDREWAIKSYETAVALKDDFVEAYYNMAVNYGCLGQYWEAVLAYRKAIDLRPDYAPAYYGLGFSYERLCRLPEATAAYSKVVELVPDQELGDQARAALIELCRPGC